MPERGPGAAGGCGFVPGARLTLRRGGRAAPGTLCAPRRLRARPRPHGPRTAASRPGTPAPWPPNFSAPAARRPPLGPHARLRSEGALGPAQPPAPRAPFPFPAAPALRRSLLLPTDSSPAVRRRGRGCSGGRRRPPPSLDAATRAKSVRAPRRGRAEGCGGVGWQWLHLPGRGWGCAVPGPLTTRLHPGSGSTLLGAGAEAGCRARFPRPAGLTVRLVGGSRCVKEAGRFTKLATPGLTESELGDGC